MAEIIVPRKVPGGTVWVCVDCIMVLANGECGERPADAPVPLNLFTAEDQPCPGMGWEEHDESCPNRLAREADPTMVGRDHDCDCETNDFSTSRCGGCGDTNHGERHAVTWWMVPTTVEPWETPAHFGE